MSDWWEQAKAAIEEALGHGYSSLDNFLGALVDAAAPAIRADEREKFGVRMAETVAAERRLAEAELRERIAQEIEARSQELVAGIATDAWEHGYEVALRDAARIARGDTPTRTP